MSKSEFGYYDNIGDLKLLEDDDPNLPVVKKHIEAGWLLKKTPEVDVLVTLNEGTPDEKQIVYRTVKYLMLLPKASSQPSSPPTTPQSKSPSPLARDEPQEEVPIEVMLEKLDFTQYFSEDKKRSWWSVPKYNIPKELIEIMQRQPNWKYVDNDGIEYVLSKSGWLSRKK